jgi:hypothetical protein
MIENYWLSCFFAALAEFVDLKRRPGDGRVEERGANNGDGMTLPEQSQRLLGITLNNDDVGRLIAVPRQNARTHPGGDFVDFRKIENVVKNSDNVDDVRAPVGHNSLEELPRHCFDPV